MTINEFNGGDPNVLYAPEDQPRVMNLFKVQVYFMLFAGQIPANLAKYLPSALRCLGPLLAGLYCIFMIGQTLHLALLFYKTTYDMFFTGELDEITTALTMTIIYSFSSFGTCYWLWRSRQLLAFMQRINRKYRHHSLAGLSYVSTYRAYEASWKVTSYWQFAAIFGVTFWAMVPIILRKRMLPLKCWYPFDPLQPVVYEFVYALQFLAQLNVGATFGNGSALFVSLVILMVGQFDVLFCSLKNLDFHARLMTGEDLRVLRKLQNELKFGADDELNQYIFAVERKTDLRIYQHAREANKLPPKPLKQALHDALVECVHLHRFVLETCNELEQLFHPYCLVKSLQITLQLCLLVFVGVAGEKSSVNIIKLVQYLALTSWELLMFTYCGELLSGHSIRAGEAFWRSEWWQNANLIRKDIMIFLVNSQRIVTLTAGKFYAMDVQRLRAVVTQAFSFYTLLQKLAAKSDK